MFRFKGDLTTAFVGGWPHLTRRIFCANRIFF
jgi:hypothetical protein